VSHTFRSEVTDLIDRYKSGELALDELAQKFRTRQWPVTIRRPPPNSYLEMAARAQEDPDSDVPNSFGDVEAAFFRHDLTIEEFEILRTAVLEAARAEDQGERGLGLT
jgi:hypothetical protein